MVSIYIWPMEDPMHRQWMHCRKGGSRGCTVGMEGVGVLALALLFPSMTQVATLLQQAMKHNFTSPALWSDQELR